MTWSSTSTVNLIELLIYLIIGPFALYLQRCYGKQNILGLLYLSLLCILRIVADIISLLPSNRNSPTPQTSVVVLSSVGLSPLVLMIAGFSHHIHVLHLERVLNASKLQRVKKYLWLAQLQIHLVSSVGVVLAVIGGIKLADNAKSLTASQVHNGETLRKVGSVLICLVWLALLHYIVWLVYVVRRTSTGNNLVLSLASWTLIATLFVGFRAVYTVVYCLDTKNV